MEGDEPKSPSLPEDSPLYEYSVRVAESVEGFQQFIDEVFEVIEQDESFNAMTVETYEHKKAYIRNLLSQLSSAYNKLADHFGDLIEEVSKNCPSMTQNPHLKSADSTSPQVTQTLAPKFTAATGYDLLFKPDGGGFYLSKAKGPSHSESETETKDPKALLEKISSLEDEVMNLKQKVERLTVENRELQWEMDENLEDVKLYMSKSKQEYETMEEGFKRSRETAEKFDEQMAGVVVEKITNESRHEYEIKLMNLKMTEYMTKLAQMKATHEKKEKIWNSVTEQLRSEVKEKSELVDQLETELASVKSENAGVLSSFDNVQKLVDELKPKVVEAEKVMERQRGVLSKKE